MVASLLARKGGWILAAVSWWVVPSAAVVAEVESHPCMTALAQGMQEERRARFPEALELLEQARQEVACRVEAELGLARTFNSMNDHKKAAVAARWVLDNTSDAELLSEASYELGRALHKPGRKMTPRQQEAEAAYRRAVELSEGENRRAVRALMRLYKETRSDDKLAKIEERFSEIRVATRAEQVRALNARKKPAAWATGPVGSVDCGTKKPAPDEDWELELPSFCDDDDEPEVARPDMISAPQPRYSEQDRKAKVEGSVEFRARLDAAGAVDRVKILKGLTQGLDAAAVDAVCQWRFEPATTPAGEPTALYFCGAVRFRLK